MERRKIYAFLTLNFYFAFSFVFSPIFFLLLLSFPFVFTLSVHVVFARSVACSLRRTWFCACRPNVVSLYPSSARDKFQRENFPQTTATYCPILSRCVMCLLFLHSSVRCCASCARKQVFRRNSSPRYVAWIVPPSRFWRGRKTSLLWRL